MTTTPDSNSPQDQDQRAIPPYDGRRTSADVDPDPDEAVRDGARVGGATGPVEGDPEQAPQSAPTAGTGGVSPADEQPAESTPEGDFSDPGVGPAHTTGTRKGEDRVEGG